MAMGGMMRRHLLGKLQPLPLSVLSSVRTSACSTHQPLVSARFLSDSSLSIGGQSSSWQSRAALVTALAGAAATVAVGTSGGAHCESASGCASMTLRDGRRLAYHVHGQGVPVFAFHGMESSSDTWDTMKWADSQPLAQLYPGVQVIAVDRPGYGDSSSPPRTYSYKTFVDDLAQLADELKIQRFCVAGHSSGGPCALAAAALLPERVVACAAVSSDAPYVHPKATAELARKGCEMECDALIRSGYFGGGKSDNHA